jgi:alanyl-tRNA synthetase
MTANEIRRSFLDYFAGHGHQVVASSSLVPHEDPTLLFTNAGMNQFKDVFLGTDRRDYRRAASSQKCMRVGGKHNDLDDVGTDTYHHTFFEMLGNFSFGDYFKADAIRLAWELLVDRFELDPDRLWFTVFEGDSTLPADEEAATLWRQVGARPDRILKFGSKDNFWSMGDTGPCGPCSEIHYFRGRDDSRNLSSLVNGVTAETVEIWNLVFMQYDQGTDGAFRPLPAPSIDTGMGFERMTAVLQGKDSNYDTDLFRPILAAISERSGHRYGGSSVGPDHPDVSMRVIADHLRGMTFLIADGVLPSNEWRGYVLRKIMRRAMRHGKKLGFADPFLCDLVDVVVGEMGGAFPEIVTERDTLVRTVRAEEERFDAVLTAGLPRLEDLLDRTAASGSTTVPGDDVFRLYDSLGVPFDFVEDLAGQRGMTIDRAAYQRAMEGQRERARAGSTFDGRRAAAFAFVDEDERVRCESMADVFEGYITITVEQATMVAIFDKDRQQVAELPPDVEGYVLLDRTPFYVEAGGQVSDVGRFTSADTSADTATDPSGDTPALSTVATVTGMTRLGPRAARVHRVTTHAPVRPGMLVTAEVDAAVRDAIRRNHTATHLLHAALRQQLGSHVRQAGSLVAPDRLRFDFTHPRGLSTDDRRAIERAVNLQVFGNAPVQTEVQRAEDAIKAGAMALFGEKYGDTVRVVSVPGYSLELCGGTHVRATGDIGPFVITDESGVAAGVRRIEALTGTGAVEYVQARAAVLERLTDTLGAPAPELPDAAARLQGEVRKLARENAQLRMKAALGGAGGTDDVPVSIGDATLITRRVVGLDKDALRGLSDSLRDRVRRGVVVLVAENDGKVQLLVSVSKDLTGTLKAGTLVKELAPIVGGGGGGRPDFAEAGGKDASKIDALLARAREVITAALTDGT